MLDFEWEGKAHFLPYRQKFAREKSEYLMYDKAPIGLPILTQEGILEWYKNESQYISGFFWVKDKFFPLHEDQSRIMREIGFELEEYVIWDRQPEYNNMKTLGYPWVFRFNKVHEYICIYWKR